MGARSAQPPGRFGSLTKTLAPLLLLLACAPAAAAADTYSTQVCLQGGGGHWGGLVQS